MNLQALSRQYFEEGRNLRDRLSQQKEELKHAQGKRAIQLERVINDLYLMCLECEKIARYLQNYYGDSNKSGGRVHESFIA